MSKKGEGVNKLLMSDLVVTCSGSDLRPHCMYVQDNPLTPT